MNYIVLDLEWNQPISRESTPYQKYGNFLTSEIIQFGAIKLDESKRIVDSFQSVVAPKCYRKLQSHVKRLTSLTQRDVDCGLPFSVSVNKFRKWCGAPGTYAFLTWGYDDIPALDANLSFYGLDSGWLNPWYNLQVIFNDQEGQGAGQKGLSAVIEYYQLEQDSQFHDALNDARYTAMIAARLDLEKGFADYFRLVNPLILGVKGIAPPLETIRAQDIPGKKAAFAMEEFSRFSCPFCGQVIAQDAQWVHQSGDRYLFLTRCPEHGAFLLRLRILKGPGESLMVLRTAEKAGEDVISAYRVREAKAMEREEKHRLKRNAREAAERMEYAAEQRQNQDR